MLRTLVIPDVHHQTSVVDEILARESFDRVVFLGDYFDDSHDNPDRARETALWLKQRLTTPEFTFLFGNHDLPYRFAVPELACSGFHPAKAEAIAEVLGEADWDRLRLHTWVDGFLLSHAGWNAAFAEADGRVTRESVDAICAECLQDLARGRMHPLAAAGPSRGGPAAVGGIVWQDWRELEPIAGLPQIVGHTPDLEVRYKHAPLGTAACLDTRLCFVGILEDSVLQERTTPVWDKWFGPNGRFGKGSR